MLEVLIQHPKNAFTLYLNLALIVKNNYHPKTLHTFTLPDKIASIAELFLSHKIYVQKILIIIQLIVGALLVAAILLQSKSASLGEAFGGGNVFYGSRRGSEKTLFIITIVLAVIFVALAYALLFV